MNKVFGIYKLKEDYWWNEIIRFQDRTCMVRAKLGHYYFITEYTMKPLEYYYNKYYKKGKRK